MKKQVKINNIKKVINKYIYVDIKLFFVQYFYLYSSKLNICYKRFSNTSKKIRHTFISKKGDSLIFVKYCHEYIFNLHT